jgi:hypothetical protein
MNKDNLIKLFTSDERYAGIIKESDEWIGDFKNRPDEEKSSSGAEYITRVSGVMEACAMMLSGNLKPEDMPHQGAEYSREALEIFKDTLFTTHYKIALINRAVHSILNPQLIPHMNKQTELEEVASHLTESGYGEYFDRDFVPQYLLNLKVKFV